MPPDAPDAPDAHADQQGPWHTPDAPQDAAERRNLIVNGQTIAPMSAMSFSFVASAGPGGQNVNKRATKCVMRVALASLNLTPPQRHRLASLGSHYLTTENELVIDCGEHRSQNQNRDECVERLSDLVRRCMVAPKVRKKTKPSKGSVRRRLEGKKVHSERKERRKRVDD